VATEVEPNFCAADVHPGGGKVCVKAFGLIQKTYNPNRVLTPMKRSNPKKGATRTRASCRSPGTRPSTSSPRSCNIRAPKA
jgi:ribosomal protein L24E